ncbi:MAG: AMP-dependent synthetase [Desulfobacteraceae bacterium]|nr:MAG: AMP-dependent synthetase [Desulfobacteraceae bacterium]
MLSPTLLHDYLRRSAALYPEKTAISLGEERLSYRELDDLSDRLSAALTLCGLKRQDRVVVFLDNCLESVISIYGILKANAVFVMINPAVKSKKLAYIIQDAGARMLITHTTKASIIQETLQHVTTLTHIIWKGETPPIPGSLCACSLDWHSTLTHAGQTDRRLNGKNNAASIDMDLAALIYTSGTTGEPKGVMATHYNMISAARSIILYLKNTPEDCILNVLPLSFGYGLYQVIAAVMFSGSVVLENSLLYIHNVLKRIPERGITGFPFVPTILAMMLKLQDLQKYDFTSLRYVTNAGAALPVPYIKKFRSMFPDIQFYSMYGLTECARASYLEPDKIDDLPASSGKAIPNCELFLVDEHGKMAKPGESGELVVRGANVMKGYWNAPALTARVFRNGHFSGDTLLYTGDFFKQDENGYLYFMGRKDDLIKCKGERLSAKEIEDVICEIQWVIESAVIGVPDDISGQAVKAFVVCDKSIRTTEKDIIKHCAMNLEPFAVPKYVEFIETLPKTDNGKINKKVLNTF